MKHNWQYKKLGEICTIKGGYTPSSDELTSEGNIPYFKVAEMNLPGNERYLIHTPAFLLGDYKTFPAQSIVFPKNGAAVATNKKRILYKDSVVDLNTSVLLDIKEVSTLFLYYILQNTDFTLLIKRGAVPTLNTSQLKEKIIPLPPLEEQQRIVAELDRINAVMEDCRQLLRTFDALAQSLFYDSFGDPISNPKAWPTENFGNLCRLSAGGDKPEDAEKEQSPEKSIPIYSNGIEDEGLYGFTSKPRISEPCITISGRGTLGVPFIRKSPFVPIIRLIVAIPNKRLNLIYLYYLTKLLNLKGKGAAIPQLTVPMIKGIQLPVPPLELQQQFACRIETIEARKKAVEKTIDTLQTLLDSRMDYWFN